MNGGSMKLQKISESKGHNIEETYPEESVMLLVIRGRSCRTRDRT